MSKYRISVSFDGQNFFWIVIDRGRFIRNPIKEDLMGTKLKSYNSTNICYRCREDNKVTDSSILRPGKALKYYKDNNETGRWLCRSCWDKDPISDNANKKEKYKRKRRKDYTDKELLDYIIQFYKKYGIPPTAKDFDSNLEYPNFATYQRRFGSWSNALKLVGLDVESMIKKGVVETSDQKARFSEMIIRDHFEKHPIDLAGENKLSHCDGICPNGKTYDVKSSRFYNKGCYAFGIHNKYKDEIEIYYLLAFNEDRTKLEYAWRIYSWEVVEKDTFYVGISHGYKFNIENMKEFEITEKIRAVLDKYEFFNKIK